MTPARAQPDVPPAGPASRLEGLLAALIDGHRALLDLAGRQRMAIRAADTRAMQACLGEQRLLLERIALLEEDRRRLVESAASAMPGSAARTPTLTELASLASPAERDRLLAMARDLRGLVEQVRRELSIIRTAASALMGHVEGVMKQVAQRLSHAQTYGRRGAVEARVTVVSSLDLTR
jgi:hypothetical protein